MGLLSTSKQRTLPKSPFGVVKVKNASTNQKGQGWISGKHSKPGPRQEDIKGKGKKAG